MSSPSYGPSDEPHAMPPNGAPRAGGSVPQGYGAPAPVAAPTLPGRGRAVTTLILGVVLMVVIAPIVTFAMMFAALAGTEGGSIKGGTTANDGVVTVTADGHFMVRGDADKNPSCSLIGANVSYELVPYEREEGVYMASDVPEGSYRLDCTAIPSTDSIVAYNATPEVVRDTFTMPFLWGSIVGVVGVIVLIVGIVLLVKVNGKRRLIMREAMMRAAR